MPKLCTLKSGWMVTEKNFNYVSLVTCGFQAPQFYEKCGYKLEFKRENKENDKLSQYFFIKYL